MNGMIFEQDKTRMSSNETKLNGTSLQLNNIKIERDNRTIRDITQSSQMQLSAKWNRNRANFWKSWVSLMQLLFIDYGSSFIT